MLFAATYPERTSALVLYGSTPRFRTDSDISWGATDEQIELMLAETSAHLGRWRPAGACSRPPPPRIRACSEVWGRFQRASASPAMARAVIAALFEIDVRDILPTIRVPTLILHRTGDLIAPVEGARLMAEQIPDARLVEFEGDDHVPFTGDFEPVAGRDGGVPHRHAPDAAARSSAGDRHVHRHRRLDARAPPSAGDRALAGADRRATTSSPAASSTASAARRSRPWATASSPPSTARPAAIECACAITGRRRPAGPPGAGRPAHRRVRA